ncbi:MAG: hypothetical protein ABFD64_05380 [Armatimonadota bacterium]
MNWLAWLFGIRHNTTPIPVDNVPEGIKSVLAAAWARFNIQWNSLDVIDQKASTLLAVISVMVTVLVTLGSHTAVGLSFWIRFIGIVVLLVSAIFALRAYKVAEYDAPSYPKKMLDYYYKTDLTEPNRQTTEMIIEHLDDIINANYAISCKKISLLRKSSTLLVIGMFIIIVAYGFG